ncbi:MAG: hypothetical protein ACOC2W_01760 [bacterium]
MKFKTLIPIVMMVMLIANVSAIWVSYRPHTIMEMEPTDKTLQQICVYEDEARTIPIPYLLGEIGNNGRCYDGNGDGGCSSGLDVPLAYSNDEFTVEDAFTLEDGCGIFVINTKNAKRDQHYAYEVKFKTLSGEEGFASGGAYVPAEEEPPVDDVPEFSVIASLVVISLAGLFIYKKRKNL